MTNGGIRDFGEVQLITVEVGMEHYGEIKMNAMRVCSRDQQMQLWSSQKSAALSPGTGGKPKETELVIADLNKG